MLSPEQSAKKDLNHSLGGHLISRHTLDPNRSPVFEFAFLATRIHTGAVEKEGDVLLSFNEFQKNRVP